MRKCTIDILIPTADKGGVENVINMVARYLLKKNVQVRIIQVVGNTNWCDERIETLVISKEAGVFQLEKLSEAYADIVKEKGIPDMILCAVWPVTCKIARMTIDRLEKEMSFDYMPKIFSWLHHGSVYYVQEAGWGGFLELSEADGHLTINSYLEQEILECIPNALVIPVKNPVDFRKYEETQKRNTERTSEKLQVIYVGRIAEEKRLDVILQGVEYAKDDCELHIVGSTLGEYEDSLKEMVEKHNLKEQVHWYSWMENPWSMASNMDLCVMASDVEGFPLVAIEALANGLPLISTPAEGIEELIEDGVNGYLYPFGDAVTLGKLLKVISRKLLPQMLPTDCKKSVERYEAAEALEDFYQSLMKIKEMD